MLSVEAKTFLEQAQQQRAFVNSAYDPLQVRQMLAAASTRMSDQVIELSASKLEVRGASNPSAVLLYVCGGGFLFGVLDQHRAFVDEVAAATGISGLLHHYRLAPEYPFPNAVNDVQEALQYVLGQYQTVFVAADSAGAALLVSAVARSATKPAGMILLSPYTDLTMSGPSYFQNASLDPSFGPEALLHKNYHYLQGASPTDSLASPYWGDLVKLPPTILFVGSTEVMRDDAVRFAEKAEHSGVQVNLQVEEKMPHVYPLYEFPEAAAARSVIVNFVSTWL